MAIHGKATGVLLGGYDLTPMLNDIGTPQSLDVNETTPFGSKAKTYIAGLADATVSMGGMFEGDMAATEELLDAAADAADAILVVYGRTIQTGRDCKFGRVIRSSFEVSSPVGDIVSISGAAQADGGLHTGPVLYHGDVETSPTNGPSHDAGAGTTRGGWAALLVTENDRDGAVTVTVQHSTDNNVWVDKATFAAVSAGEVTSEVLDLDGTINRYTRVVVTLAGSTGSAVVNVALSRG